MVETRLDIACAALVVSRFVKNPSHLHSKVVKIVFYYLKITRDIGINNRGDQRRDLIITTYSNFNWAGNHVIRKSLSGFILMLNNKPIN